jgi:hypothetical protein
LIDHAPAERAEPAKPWPASGIAGSAGCARLQTDQAAAPARSFARAALDLAAQVQEADRQLLAAVLQAAKSGDCRRVERIALAWRDMPALDALKVVRD